MYEIPETATHRAFGSLWNWIWPLLFIVVLTIASIVTEHHSGYFEPHLTGTNTTQSSPAPAR